MSSSNQNTLTQDDYKSNGCPKTIGPLDQGGQGFVYRCRGGKVYKVVKDEPDQNRGRHLYKDLDHPNLIKLTHVRPATPERFGLGQVKCYSNELDKTVLTKIIEDGNLSAKEVTKLMNETLDAVDYLHQNQVIHCDLKPGNIMLDKSGNNVIIDLDSSRQSWDLKEPLSTPSYVPPEWYRDNGVQNGEKFDSFCLGMTYAEAALGLEKFGWDNPQTLQEKMVQIRNVKAQLMEADIPEAHRKQILELLEVDVKDRPSVAEAKTINKGSEEAKMIPVKAYRAKAVEKADQKAKQQQTYTVIGGLASVAGGLVQKAATGEKIDVKQDVTKPLVRTGIKAGQTEFERQLRTSIKSQDFTKKVGFKAKAGLVVGGAAVSEAVNQLFFDKDRDSTSTWEKSKRIGLETGCSVAEYGLNYGGAKLVKTALKGGVEKVTTYGAGKGISTGTALLTKAGGSTVTKVVSSGAFGLVSLSAGLAVDGVRILASKEDNKTEAFKQAAKTNLVATAGQAIGATVGSALGPVGTVLGGILGAAAGSFIASYWK